MVYGCSSCNKFPTVYLFSIFLQGLNFRVESQDILPKLTLEKGHGLEEMMELDWGNFPKMAELFSECLFDANPDLFRFMTFMNL